VPSRIGQYGNGLFQRLPVPVKAGLIGVSGLAGTLGIRSLRGSLSKGLGSLLKKFTPNIAESEAGATTFSKMFGTFSKSGVASKALGALAPIGAGIGIYNTSKNMVGSIKDLYSSFSDHDNYYTSDAYKNKLLQGEERRQHPIKSLFGVTDYSKLSADDFQEKWNALSSSSNFGHTPGQQDYIKALKNLQEKEQSKYEEVDKVLSTAEKNHTVNIVVSGKVDGMDETNQETVGKSISDYFASLFGVHPSTNGINLSVDQKFK
jgi:hypothetical protein